MAFLLNGKPLAVDVAFSHNDINYPANWLRLSSAQEKRALGITEVADAPYIIHVSIGMMELQKQ